MRLFMLIFSLIGLGGCSSLDEMSSSAGGTSTGKLHLSGSDTVTLTRSEVRRYSCAVGTLYCSAYGPRRICSCADVFD